jgi:hypothetical protein
MYRKCCSKIAKIVIHITEIKSESAITMGRVRSKSDLPTKICPVCQRPFTWRKKWEDCWDEVKYCSERCRRRRSEAKNETNPY